ncbi:MAG: (2Fe-2S)-binding protein [Deltaproteobacteria bacterium]|nr:(2Fe-2S)-binding protein [Deltaproteobacteria bacterium]
MERTLEFTLNGEPVRLAIDSARTLLEVLRTTLGLTGTKEGCGRGQCGACTVLLNGKAVPSCLVLAADAQGAEVLTIEGLAAGDSLHPLQSAFVERGAIQCGYCTSGMILAGKALLDRNPSPTDPEIREAVAGNLCRCTGYAKIVEAIGAAARSLHAGTDE